MEINLWGFKSIGTQLLEAQVLRNYFFFIFREGVTNTTFLNFRTTFSIPNKIEGKMTTRFLELTCQCCLANYLHFIWF